MVYRAGGLTGFVDGTERVRRWCGTYRHIVRNVSAHGAEWLLAWCGAAREGVNTGSVRGKEWVGMG
ncbi:MAG: hypothetical protein K2I86_08265 [Prevotella sp.]|nr:hypothetical protein [Prevotella sp.]